MTKNRIIAWSYGIFLHFLVIYFLYNPFAIINQYWRFNLGHIKNDYLIEQLYQYHFAVDKIIDNIPVLLLGDSHLQRMDTTLIHQKTINFSVGGDTVQHINDIISHLESVKKAKNIVILAGVNDLMNRHYTQVITDYKKLLQKIPIDTNIFIVTIPPVANNFKYHLNQDIISLNQALLKICHIQNQCTILDLHKTLTDNNHHFLIPLYDYGDKIHLSKQAYVHLADLMNHHIPHKL